MFKARIFIVTFLNLFCCSTMISHYGVLCSIEGIDGAGKTTLIKNLQERFASSSLPVVFTREPGGTQFGQHMRQLLIDRPYRIDTLAEYLLFAADRAQHFSEFVAPHLQKGFLVISDRMADSSVAYQGYVKGLDRDMIAKVNSWCMSNIAADVVIYLRITPEQAQKRICATRSSQTVFEQEYFNRMYTLFDAFEEIFQHRSNILIVDALLDPDFIANQIFNFLQQLLEVKCSSSMQSIR